MVTGATGLIGTELAGPLSELGFDIYAITMDEKNPENGIKWLRGNLFDEKFVESAFADVKPAYLLNMAWATTGDYLKSDINYRFLTSGIKMAEEFAKHGGKRAVYAGTCFEYKFKDAPIKEGDELDPDKFEYTFCKNKLREIAGRYFALHGVSFGWGRIFYVYGTNEHKTRLTGMVLDKLSRSEKVTINAGSLIKDYLFTKDIAGAFAGFLDSMVEGCVNICSGKGVSIRDYVLGIAEKLGKRDLVEFAEEAAGAGPKMIIGDNSRLTQEVGYTAKWTLDAAIKEIIKGLQ